MRSRTRRRSRARCAWTGREASSSSKPMGWPIVPTRSRTRPRRSSHSPVSRKGLTALTVVSLIEDGSLHLETTARSVLGGDLPLIDDGVTIEHLLAHRSGIGDYLDEEGDWEITDHMMPVSCLP